MNEQIFNIESWISMVPAPLIGEKKHRQSTVNWAVIDNS